MSLQARFFGSYEHALDAKGRVILPSRLRAHFTGPGYLTPHLEGCLALWTEQEFEKEIELRLALADTNPVARNDVRDWAAAVFETEIDRQGRMPIPANLRSYAGLEQEVLILGMINRVELWAPGSWATKQGSAGDSEPSAQAT